GGREAVQQPYPLTGILWCGECGARHRAGTRGRRAGLPLPQGPGAAVQTGPGGRRRHRAPGVGGDR
ncbi:MAG TPA: hypothetical protein VLA19_29130, partial [Herpetosiphonaceae bacterium]|nr:hypothetical protein [Herpetosiphonaceae bacterium]